MVLLERIPYANSGDTATARERLLDVGSLTRKLFENVLIPIELDSDVKQLTSLAADLAGRFHSQFLLVHVAPHEPTLARDAAVLENRRAELEQIAATLRQAGAVHVQCLLFDGNPAYHVEQTAKQHDVSLILLSDRAETPQAHAWFGTLTQKLARRVNVPLMVVKSQGQAPLKPVLSVVDFSESSRKALKYAIALSREMGTKLTVLHVVPEPLAVPLVEGPIWQTYTAPSRASNERSRYASKASSDTTRRTLAARRELEEFLKGFDFSRVTYDTLVSCGSPVLETLTVAKEKKSGVIAIGSDHRTGFVHLMSQSTAETLAETADVPVLIFRSEGERSAMLPSHVVTGTGAAPIQ
jgi:nucleotide-binding universal stress UspA family protein